MPFPHCFIQKTSRKSDHPSRVNQQPSPRSHTPSSTVPPTRCAARIGAAVTGAVDDVPVYSLPH